MPISSCFQGITTRAGSTPNRSISRAGAALMAAALIAVPYTASAENLIWTGQTNGDWGLATNWSPSLLPGANDVTQFDASGLTSTVTLSSAYSIRGVSFLANAPEYTITTAPGSSTAKLTLPSYGLSSIDNSSSAAFQTIAVNLNLNRQRLTVNTIEAGATTLFTGNTEMSLGSFSVFGSGTTKVTGNIVNTNPQNMGGTGGVGVGGGFNSGASKLLIANGGSIIAGDGSIAHDATVTVDGTGSLWRIGGSFHNGGLLAVKGGGHVQSTKTSLGLYNSSNTSSKITVDGSGSYFSTGMLMVGEVEDGTIDVANGGALYTGAGESNIGYSGGTGEVNVRGTGSLWEIGSLYVGRSGRGSVLIAGGAKVSGFYTVIAGADGSFFPDSGLGIVTVDGAGSELISPDLNVGYHGTGQLNILNGGKVTTVDSIIGGGQATFFPGSQGTGIAVVDGAGSQWNNSGSLQVGDKGVGTLTITNGGAVNVTGQTSINGLSTLTVNGGTLTTGSLSVASASQTVAISDLDKSHPALVIGSNSNSTFNGILADASGGSGSIKKVQSGVLTLTANNSYTGTTHVAGGTLRLTGSSQSSEFIVDNGAILDFGGQGNATLDNGQRLNNNGKVTGLTAPLSVVGGAVVGGSGDYSEVDLRIADGGTLSPGNSPGTLAASDMIWGGGGDYLWEINNAVGTPGTNYDFVSLSGNLDVTATSVNPFHISLASLMGNNQAGALTGWDPAQGWNWTILTATGGIDGFNAANVRLDTADFLSYNSVDPSGLFYLSQSGNNLVLSYAVVPESGTGLLTLIGMLPLGVGYAITRSRRR